MLRTIRWLVGMVLCASVVVPGLAAEPCTQAAPLFAAVTANHPAEIRRLLDCGAPLEARNAAGQTPLLVATHHNHVAPGP